MTTYSGVRNPNYKRGYRLDNGYVSISLGERGKERRLHVLMAEKALGRPLKKGEGSHHVNENKQDNRNGNLVICKQSFHRFLHQRFEALKNCGHADWRKCWICKKYDTPENLRHWSHNKIHCHTNCYRNYREHYLPMRNPAKKTAIAAIP